MSEPQSTSEETSGERTRLSGRSESEHLCVVPLLGFPDVPTFVPYEFFEAPYHIVSPPWGTNPHTIVPRFPYFGVCLSFLTVMQLSSRSLGPFDPFIRDGFGLGAAFRHHVIIPRIQPTKVSEGHARQTRGLILKWQRG